MADPAAYGSGPMNRAYALLDIKEMNEERRMIEGMASTPTVDRMHDVVEPMGAKFAVPMPLLLDHDSRSQVGHVVFAKPTKSGIPFKATISRVDEPGEVQDLVNKAWQLVKYKLRAAVSIGFRPLKDGIELLEDGGLRFKNWEFLELSLVSIPANAEAVIYEAKSFDEAIPTLRNLDADLLAATGTDQVGSVSGDAKAASSSRPGASGKHVNLKRKERTMSKTISEQIAALEAKRAANDSRMNDIMAKAMDEGRSTDEAERDEFDELERENETVEGDLKRFKALERANVASARPVSDVKTVEDGSTVRGGGTVRVTGPKAEPGIRFARVAKCIGMAKGNFGDAARIAESRYQDDQGIQNVLKAAVAAGTTSDATWAGPLVGDEGSIFADFVEYLRPMTILGKFGANGVPALRRVPFRVPLISQTSGGSGYWVGEGAAKPLTQFDFSRTTLEPLKVANIAVVTEEVLRDSSPSAETILRDQLAAALRLRLDTDFIDPDKAASAGISPASITNAATPIASTGNTADDIREDIRQVFNAFIAANNAPTTGVWIMPATVALSLSLMQGTLGQPEFPGITMNGGTLFGLPVIVSEFVPTVAASSPPAASDGSYVVLVNATDIYLGDDGGISVDMSREASLQMDNAPTGTSATPTATSLVSLWQTNSVGFRAERTINWMLRRATAVQVLNGVTWGQPSA